MLQRSYFVSSVPIINPDHPELQTLYTWCLREVRILFSKSSEKKKDHGGMAVYRKILFLINKLWKSAWKELSGLGKNHLLSDFVTSGCPEMPKMFPQMCPGLWYLRNLITSPDYVKSRQTLTCLILVTRDSQPICTFLPQSPPCWCYLCIWILMARVSSVVILVSSGGSWYISDIRLIGIRQRQTENHLEMAAIEAGLIIIADQLWEIYIRGKQDHILWIECTSMGTWRCGKYSSLLYSSIRFWKSCEPIKL